MSESISLTVPEQTTSCFVVATDEATHDIPLGALRRLSEPFATAATERLGSPSLAITSYPAAHSPWSLDHAVSDLDGDDLDLEDRLFDARRHIGVTAEVASTDRPYGLRLARAVARCVADHLDAVAVDIATGQVLSERTSEHALFRLADDWLGARLPPHRNGGRCKVSDDDIDGCECVELTTSGLTRFGLPELQMSRVSCAHDLAALNVLRTTAQHLLPMGNRPGGHTFPRLLPLTGSDFAAYWGAGDPMWSDAPVEVRLTQLSPQLLDVGPPEDFPGTLNEWLWDELPPVLYDLLSCGRDQASTET
ncbi:hypothetical protein Acsp03_54960 [Actinomadura sp. NBRC 104412]|uniref:hypothetical protein n=1 Tax=Actinomadura sp. NBRC 104412 TaxID=3032203 RepID=UPI0024A14123|nr:hypothetical protein [Actinomadura sp. NBRC 104412]GLZ08030.1 hypothetical protein Acsp03_54960 [Actinomadura sp. NBRC 104412]